MLIHQENQDGPKPIQMEKGEIKVILRFSTVAELISWLTPQNIKNLKKIYPEKEYELDKNLFLGTVTARRKSTVYNPSNKTDNEYPPL